MQAPHGPLTKANYNQSHKATDYQPSTTKQCLGNNSESSMCLLSTLLVAEGHEPKCIPFFVILEHLQN